MVGLRDLGGTWLGREGRAEREGRAITGRRARRERGVMGQGG